MQIIPPRRDAFPDIQTQCTSFIQGAARYPNRHVQAIGFLYHQPI